jgi:hypothetical protein
MERSQRYEHISGYSGLVAGIVTIMGSVVLRLGLLRLAFPANFIVVWSAVFGIAFASHLLFTFGRARQRGELVWSRQARTILLAVLPAFTAALIVTALIWRLGRPDLLPAVWLTLYGCGVLATSFFAPRSIAWLGGTCFALGAIALLAPYTYPILTMAIGFGVTHVGFGVAVLIAERRESRARAFWSQIEQLAVDRPTD